MPSDTIVWDGPEQLRPLLVPIDQLAPLPGNPRRGDIEAVARSLARFGQRKNLTVRPNGITSAGNHTRLAALSLGWTHLAVITIDEDDPTSAAWSIADNRTSDLAVNDDKDLAAMLSEIAAADAELLHAASYTDTDLADLLKSLEPPFVPRTDPDEVPEPPLVPVTQPGDVWVLGDHRLVCGDAADKRVHDLAMGGGVADLVLTDPPYGVGVDYGPETDDTAETISDLMAKVMPMLLAHKRALLTCGHTLMWDYPKPTWLLAWVHPAGMGAGPWGFTCLHPVLAYGPDPYLERQAGGRPDVLVLATDRADEQIAHPVVKPMEAWRWLLRRGSPAVGEIVFDPFMGSGTTLIAAELEGRQARGVEISPAYCDVAVQRWQNMTGREAHRQ